MNNNFKLHLYRFPLTKPALLQKWEDAVRQTNHKPEWRATRSTVICSKHFDVSNDYILKPSEDGTCRLKNSAVPTISSNTGTQCGLARSACRRLDFYNYEKEPVSPAAIVLHDHTYSKRPVDKQQQSTPDDDGEALQDKLKRKIKGLQQQLRRTKAKQQTMADIIQQLEQKSILTSTDADVIREKFDEIQLSIFRDTKNNVSCSPCGRRYSDIVKEFATTLHYYSPKAYEYVRTILPLPNPSLIRKWSSSLPCEPGFMQEAFDALNDDVKLSPNKRDCFLIIDAMAIRKQVFWDAKQQQYVGFVNYGSAHSPKPDTVASEALVFLLVGARSHWKCPVGYFLTDKMSSKTQADLVTEALKIAAKAGLRVWSITTDGTAVNLGMYQQLGCSFTTCYDSTVTRFKHPSEDYYVYATLDPCHMVKLARNAMASLGSFLDDDEQLVKWKFLEQLNTIQEHKGLKLANKLSNKHLHFEKHKMNVSLAAQTLSSSVADAIEFLNVSMKWEAFEGSEGTVTFIRTIDRLFDMLNARNPAGVGFKQPLRPESRNRWEPILQTTARYLLNLKTNTAIKQPLSTHPRKTFIVGFVSAIKSTIEMANEMFSLQGNPFKYLLPYKYSQDHVELLFSCIRRRGGWNNNPNCAQFKHALRRMLMRNAIAASKNANCQDFTGISMTTVIPFFQLTHKSAVKAPSAQPDTQSPEIEEIMMAKNLDDPTSEFLVNVLFYIAGYVVSKLVHQLSCLSCKRSLLADPFTDNNNNNMTDEVTAASAFTLFVNNGGLRVPSSSVYQVVEYCEKVFKANVCKEGQHITSEKLLKTKMIIKVNNYFALDTQRHLFEDHEEDTNERVFEDDHRTKLVKLTADRYFTIRLFTYGKHYNESVVAKGQTSERHRLTKLILFKNQ